MQVLTIAGNVGKDAEIRRTQGGDAVLNFSIAVDNGKNKDGSKREATWYECALWGKRAESLQGHITKGSKLAVTGRPTARAYEGKAYLGINVDQLTFQGGGQQQNQGGYDGGSGYGAGGRPGDDGGDSIPFAMCWEV